MTTNFLADLVFAAECSAPVLIAHPSDVSRETYARFIHEHSRLRESPFIAIFCREPGAGPIPALLRTTFRRIRRGTLFLDGINELDAPTQTELMSLLVNGASQAPPIHMPPFPSPHVRLIAGSREPLPPIVAAGRFSASLFLDWRSLRSRTAARRRGEFFTWCVEFPAHGAP
jgi:DNA-binding NtrC family response regulator